MAKPRRSNVDIVRYGILGTLAVIVVVVVGYSLLYATGLIDDPENYVELEDAELKTDPLEVVEFFSFQCPHCQALDPELLDWAEDLPEGVEFRQVHVGFNLTARNLARAFLVLKQRGALDQNRDRLFKAATTEDPALNNGNGIAELVDGHGITKDQFLSLFNGSRIGDMLTQSQEEVTKWGVQSVPLVLIGEKYVVTPVAGRQQMIKTIERLVDESLNAGLAQPDDSASTETSSSS